MINLIYIRAAIEEKTGIRLPLHTVIDYLFSEGLINRTEANGTNLIFRGYSEYYSMEDYSTSFDSIETLKEGYTIQET
tara:strand:- start:2327 stop:2560 length:234 start_codon:yes stop_codon:yes gene_type:complete